MTITPLHPNLISYNLTPPDLHSARATNTPTFGFPSLEDQTSPLAILACANPLATCLHTKSWLLRQHEDPAKSAPGILRMDYLELEQIESGREGWLLVTPTAAKLEAGEWSGDGEADTSRVSVMAVFVKGDPRVRWFYTLLPISPLLEELDEQGLVELRRVLEPTAGTSQSRIKFKRLHTFIRQCFPTAIKIPESSDFLAAQQISDFCPSISDPATALGRLEAEAWLYWNAAKPEESLLAPDPADPSQDGKKGKGKGKENATTVATLNSLDPSDDRYLHHLHPAERELASLAKLKCAEYLFLKRNFFHAFWEEVYRSEKIADQVAPASTSNPVASRRLDPRGRAANDADAATPAPTEAGRRDTPVTPSTTPAPSQLDNTPAPTPASVRRSAGYDKAKRGRVRTERAHQVWLETAYKCRTTQARTLVIGWRVLGFLDETRYLGWVRDGWGGDEDEDEEEEE